jgi:hypothetical protein
MLNLSSTQGAVDVFLVSQHAPQHMQHDADDGMTPVDSSHDIQPSASSSSSSSSSSSTVMVASASIPHPSSSSAAAMALHSSSVASVTAQSSTSAAPPDRLPGWNGDLYDATLSQQEGITNFFDPL